MNECILNEITRPDQNKSGHIMLSMRNGRIAEHPTVQRGKFILVNNEYIDDKNIEKKRKKKYWMCSWNRFNGESEKWEVEVSSSPNINIKIILIVLYSR